MPQKVTQSAQLQCDKDTMTAGWKNMDDYLSEQLIAQKGSKYNNYKKVFFMAQEGYSIDENDAISPTAGEILSGYTSGENMVMLLSSISSDTSHELLHSLGIAHTWVSKNHQDPNVRSKTASQGLHSFEYKKTYNIMDYTSNGKDFIYAWQAKLANNKAIAEPTNYTPAP
jgi:hypothetical protein